MDKQLFLAVHHLQRFHLDWLLAWPTYLGTVAFTLSFIFIGVLWKSRRQFLPRFLAAAFPVVLAHESAEWIKAFYKVDRPFVQIPGMVHILFETPGNYSFPSGHTSTAFAAAAVLTRLGVPPAIAYGLAALVGITRLYVGVHFPSDVLAGAVLGLLISSCYLRFFPYIRKNL